MYDLSNVFKHMRLLDLPTPGRISDVLASDQKFAARVALLATPSTSVEIPAQTSFILREDIHADNVPGGLVSIRAFCVEALW